MGAKRPDSLIVTNCVIVLIYDLKELVEGIQQFYFPK